MCIIYWFSIFVDIYPSSSCIPVPFSSTKFFFLTSSYLFIQFSFKNGDVSSGNSYITYSKVSWLVSVSFSFMFLYITSSFQYILMCLPLLHLDIFFSYFCNIFSTNLRHIWGCDIWSFFYYLIQGIPITFCFVYTNSPLYHIVTLLHHSWWCDPGGYFFSIIYLILV